jgi:hypothetical protein
VRHWLGVDFGTSNTVAMLRWPDGRVRPLLFDGGPMLPSAVLASDQGLLVGREAQHLARLRPEAYEPNPKRRIDDGTVLLGDRELSTVELFAAVLHRVAEEASRVAPDIEQATLTCPAAWGTRRRQVLLDAAAQAELPQPRLVDEPIAAASYFARITALPVGASVVVYDFGAGTFDAGVVRRSTAGFEVLASEGLTDAGGLDIDAAIVSYFAGLYSGPLWQRLSEPKSSSDRRANRLLWDDVRSAKETLSRTSTTLVPIPLLDADAPLGREQLEQLAGAIVRRTVDATAAVLRTAGLSANQVAGVFLVGGSSRIPLAATLLHRALGVAPTVIEQPELVVAEGSLDAITGTAPGSVGARGVATIPPFPLTIDPVNPTSPAPHMDPVSGMPFPSVDPVSGMPFPAPASGMPFPASAPPFSASAPPASAPISGPPVADPSESTPTPLWPEPSSTGPVSSPPLADPSSSGTPLASPMSPGPLSSGAPPASPVSPGPYSSGPPPGPYSSGPPSRPVPHMPPPGAPASGPPSAGPLSFGPPPASPVSPGPLSFGPPPASPVSPGPLSFGPLPASPVSPWPLAAGPPPAGAVSSGPLPTGPPSGPPFPEADPAAVGFAAVAPPADAATGVATPNYRLLAQIGAVVAAAVIAILILGSSFSRILFAIGATSPLSYPAFALIPAAVVGLAAGPREGLVRRGALLLAGYMVGFTASMWVTIGSDGAAYKASAAISGALAMIAGVWFVVIGIRRLVRPQRPPSGWRTMALAGVAFSLGQLSDTGAGVRIPHEIVEYTFLSGGEIATAAAYYLAYLVGVACAVGTGTAAAALVKRRPAKERRGTPIAGILTMLGGLFVAYVGLVGLLYTIDDSIIYEYSIARLEGTNIYEAVAPGITWGGTGVIMLVLFVVLTVAATLVGRKSRKQPAGVSPVRPIN